MRYYAEGIQKFQKQLGLPVKSFPDLGLYEIENDDSEANDDTDDARQTTAELESSKNTNEDDIEQDSYGYGSEAQRRWRERMQKYY